MPESAEWIRLHGIEEKETDDMTRKTKVKPVKLVKVGIMNGFQSWRGCS
jgi:hypothetical protein